MPYRKFTVPYPGRCVPVTLAIEAALLLSASILEPACAQTQPQGPAALPPVVVKQHKPKVSKRAGKPAPHAAPAEERRRQAEPAAPPVPAAPTGPSANITTTEGSDSYASDHVSVGGKVPVEFKESTQSTSVITYRRLRDQNLNTVEEALNQTMGLTVNPTGSGLAQILMRGYFLDTVQVDGMPYLLSTGLLANAADMSPYDHVEVLHGADGMFQGAGYPGGVVNLERKHALDHAQVLTSTGAGSWGLHRGMLDATGPLTENGTVRGRLVTTYQERDFFYSEAHERKELFYGTLEADLTKSTTVSIGALRQDTGSTPFFGLPAFSNGLQAGLARSTFAGADWNRDDQSMTDYFADFEYRFSNGGHIKFSGREIERSRDAKYAYVGAAANPVTGAVPIATTASLYDVEQSDADAHLYMPFSFLGLKQSILAGADYKRYDSDFSSGTGPSVSQNIFALSPHIAEPAISYRSRTGVVTEQTGLYGQLRLKPLPWTTFVLGGRVTNWENTTNNLMTHAVTLDYSIDGRKTPYAGLIIDLTPQISLYGSYTDIFSPQGSIQWTGEGMPPRIGTQYETGLKSKFLNDRLNVSASLFLVRDTGRALPDALHPGYFIPAGLSESKGFEAEVSGALAAGWQVYGGYSYTITEYLTAGAADSGGSMLPMLPLHSVNLWTTYTFQERPLKDFMIGAGIKAITDFYRKMSFGNNSGVRYNGDGYIIVNATISYIINDSISISLNINNIFDEKYFQNVGPSQNFYGEPRSAMLRLDKKF